LTDKKTNAIVKVLVVAAPLVLLLASITLYQIYSDGNPSQDPASITQQLKLVGNSNTSEFGLSLTFTNAGNKQLTILQVIYNGTLLTQGVLGGAVALFAVNNISSFCEVPTNDLIFPQTQHWNMDTGGLCSATILPGGDATLYLGVSLSTQSLHVLQAVTDEGNYTFTVNANPITP